MIKVDVIEEEDGVKIYLDSNSEADRDKLDMIFQAVMTNDKKIGGFSSSLSCNVLVLNK